MVYIPHHGVYHPAKPGKIRVVFDRNAECLGYALNKQMITGPDLTNQIISVLKRFREEQVAFMGGIEAMLYQVQIPESHWSKQRFLWWDGIMMCVHVFGGASSSSCCNYAFKRTSIHI